MTNLLSKLTSWFCTKPVKKKPNSCTKPSLNEPLPTQRIKTKHFNSHHYRQLIGKLASKGIAVQRQRTQERRKL